MKIETAGAVKNFPALLMQGMQEDVFGVMIARGDLAVEIGFERMSEIQEEILWISEASGGHHVKKRYTFRPMSIASNYLNA